MLCGVFVHAARMRQLHPVLTYCRAALRLAMFAATLPRGRTRLTAAGRSQFAAYLFHDSVFSLGSLGLAVLLPEAPRAAALAALARWLPPPSSMARMPLARSSACRLPTLLQRPASLLGGCRL